MWELVAGVRLSLSRPPQASPDLPKPLPTSPAGEEKGGRRKEKCLRTYYGLPRLVRSAFV